MTFSWDCHTFRLVVGMNVFIHSLQYNLELQRYNTVQLLITRSSKTFPKHFWKFVVMFFQKSSLVTFLGHLSSPCNQNESPGIDIKIKAAQILHMQKSWFIGLLKQDNKNFNEKFLSLTFMFQKTFLKYPLHWMMCHIHAWN